jgi:CO/xanthine dehydrogenase FAD-binding subunit
MILLRIDGTCSDVRITAFGVGPQPTRLPQAEEQLREERPTTTLVRAVARRAAAETSPMHDNHASAAYRRHLAEVLVERSISEAIVRCSR